MGKSITRIYPRLPCIMPEKHSLDSNGVLCEIDHFSTNDIYQNWVAQENWTKIVTVPSYRQFDCIFRDIMKFAVQQYICQPFRPEVFSMR